ncbi:MAG: heparan-alpha-glucosaminide N-acetyltransferase domain-containing protein [Clostridia bacterium]|nr:heparan-alpha-glucosaminide N-acetyltransferase domain-containing protein [Clostridia bacterium]
MASAKGKKRIHMLDELRGLAVFCMVFYHAFYSMSEIFGMKAGTELLKFFMPAQPYFAALFIVISGISSRLSHDNTKRGVRLLLVALGLTVITAVIMPLMGFDGAQIYFGILHLLSLSMLVFSLARKGLDKVNPVLGVCICALLYALTFNVSNGFLGFPGKFGIALPDILYQTNYFMPFGFYSQSFYSADYFPLLPHAFMFLIGTFVGVYAASGAFPAFSYKQRSKFLSFLGRHALIIYIIHQPIIYVIFYVAELIIKAIA